MNHQPLDNLFASLPVAWLSEDARENDVVLSTRVRLARNIAGHRFPEHASPDEREDILRNIANALTSCAQLPMSRLWRMTELHEVARNVLLERQLISRQLCNLPEGGGVSITDVQDGCLIVNEEDHIRLMAIRPGLDLDSAWAQVDRLDSELMTRVSFMFDETLGFQTACPSNVGTGLRASAMMHLPGLVLTGQLQPLFRALDQLGMAARGWFGEGTDNIGDVFQVSNQSTLGENETQILQRFEKIVRQLIWSERNARKKMVQTKANRLDDSVARAYGILKHARRIDTGEALAHLCSLRVGISMHLFRRLRLPTVNALLIGVQPGHLQVAYGKPIEDDARDSVRAEMVRDRLKHVGCEETSRH